jgi:hypothetical protein
LFLSSALGTKEFAIRLGSTDIRGPDNSGFQRSPAQTAGLLSALNRKLEFRFGPKTAASIHPLAHARYDEIIFDQGPAVARLGDKFRKERICAEHTAIYSR